jgi:ABC-type branched-subunit amino acid transport system substrate-binding protein
MSSYAATSPSFLESAGKLADGLLTTNAFLPGATPAAQKFEDEMLKRHGKDPWPIISAMYYDGVRLLLAALNKVGPDPIKIAKALESITGFKAVTAMPSVPFSATNHESIQAKDVYLSKVANGQLVKP